MSDDIRAAAERIIALHPSRRDGLWEEQVYSVARAFLELLDEQLAEHPADDDEPVTEERSRIIASCDEHGDICPLEDGFQYYWTNRGALTADNLRTIADELDRRNKDWQDLIEKEMKESTK